MSAPPPLHDSLLSWTRSPALPRPLRPVRIPETVRLHSATSLPCLRPRAPRARSPGTPAHTNRCRPASFPRRTPLLHSHSLTFLEHVVLKCHCYRGPYGSDWRALELSLPGQQKNVRTADCGRPTEIGAKRRPPRDQRRCVRANRRGCPSPLPLAAGPSLGQSTGEPGLSDGEEARVFRGKSWARRGARRVSRGRRRIALKGPAFSRPFVPGPQGVAGPTFSVS